MKFLNINDVSISSVFNEILNQLDASITNEYNPFHIQIESAYGKGICQGKNYSDSICFFKFNFSLKDDLTLTINSYQASSSLYFIYSNQGHLLYQSKYSKYKLQRINERQTAILKARNNEIKLNLPSNNPLEIIIIKINPFFYSKKENINSYFKGSLHPILDFLNNKSQYAYFGEFNFKAIEVINNLNNITEKGMVRDLLMEGQVKLLLALFIQQYNGHLPNTRSFNLSNLEIKKINKIALEIRNNPRSHHSIKKIVEQHNISVAKLQKGFKMLHKKTVGDYVKNIRLEIAEEMIKEREYTISEIVYKVGFSSKSYFSKIFKIKFGFSPKQYQEIVKESLIHTTTK
ncbi:MAG: AraC family transcriptional regulator [Galbibacter orientalis]|uniref:helix-turn-helix domain-containing protein n=1 Tax=Galbibacter orientalis TaxID=453852 RepID=UPI003002F152